MRADWTPREAGKRVAMVCLLAAALLVSSGIAAAAVSGSFSAEYDGWDDGDDADVVGHEIRVEGTMTVSGNSLVNPRIVVHPGEYTVLDYETVSIFVEGDRSIQFDKTFREQSVEYRAEEVPAGTELRIQFVAYYVGGAPSADIEASRVNVFYQTPGGDDQREVFRQDLTLENRPEAVIQGLRTDLRNREWFTGTIDMVLTGLGVLFLLYLGYRLAGGGGGDGDSVDI